MLAVFRREIKAYYSSPTGYIFMGFFLLICGFFFALYNIWAQSRDYLSVLGNIAFIFLFLVPILTMRLISEETRQKTDQLLLTSPLSLSNLVLGKYLAAVAVFGITLLVTVLYPIILSFFGTLALAEIIGGYVGFFLLGSAFISIGLFISSLTDNQIIAAVATFGALLLMWILGWIQQGMPTDRVSGVVFAVLLVIAAAALVYFTMKNIYVSVAVILVGAAIMTLIYIINPFAYDGLIVKFLDWFSLLKRYDGFTRGILSLSSVFYFISFCSAFLFLTVRVIEKRRWS